LDVEALENPLFTPCGTRKNGADLPAPFFIPPAKSTCHRVTIRNGEESVFSSTALLRSGFISVICVDIPLGSRQNARMNSVFLQPR
jgi:hypothetical protein